MSPKLQIDIKRGAILEDWCEDYFKAKGWTVKRAKGNVPAYDQILTKGQQSISVEIKHDEMSDRTQNYCLERASLEHTQSDYLVIGTPREAYILKMNEARKLFNQYPKKQTGDIPDNVSAIVPKTVFASYQRL